MNSSLFITSRLLLALGLFSFLIFIEGRVSSSQAATLSNRDLREFGFKGIYRGFATGRISVWEGEKYEHFDVDDNATIKLPVRSRVLVVGPTSGNRFYLDQRPATGNSRRIKIRGAYSGISYNPKYGENMIARGSKVINVVKLGNGRPAFRMTVNDNITERSVRDGAIFGKWSIYGELYK